MRGSRINISTGGTVGELHRILAGLLAHALVCLPWLPGSAPAAADEIILYAYHLKPPYIIDRAKQVGLYYDVARYLNERIASHTFKTVYLPRKRLETQLEMGQLHGMVIGVHPTWFKDGDRTRYLWSPPFMHDEDIVVSRASEPVNYEQPESLVGKHVGLSFGYYYYGVDELVKAGKVERDDAINEEITLDKLVHKRVDAAIVTRSTYDYMLRQRSEWQKLFYIARKPHDAFERMILMPREFGAAAPGVAVALTLIMQDPAWQKLMRSY